MDVFYGKFIYKWLELTDSPIGVSFTHIFMFNTQKQGDDPHWFDVLSHA
jgi:hypothetical protein